MAQLLFHSWFVLHLLDYLTLGEVTCIDSALCNRELRRLWLACVGKFHFSACVCLTNSLLSWIVRKSLHFCKLIEPDEEYDEDRNLISNHRSLSYEEVSELLRHLGTECPQLQYVDVPRVKTFRTGKICNIDTFVGGCKNLRQCNVSMKLNDWLRLLETFGRQRSWIKGVYIYHLRTDWYANSPTEEEATEIINTLRLFAHGCPQLEEFYLKNLYLPAEGINHLVTNCPLISSLSLIDVPWDSAVEVGKLKYLKTLMVDNTHEMKIEPILKGNAGKSLQKLVMEIYTQPCGYEDRDDQFRLFDLLVDTCPNLRIFRSYTLAPNDDITVKDVRYFVERCPKLIHYSGTHGDEIEIKSIIKQRRCAKSKVIDLTR